MTKQKWSGVKLTKKELEQIHKEERTELLAEIFGFICVLGTMTFILIVLILLMGGGK